MDTTLMGRVESTVDGQQGRSLGLPLVSVLMPVRNEAAWIARSLGAVLAQDYPAELLEVLLIDGASEDETLRIARALPGSERVRVLRNPRRLQAAGLNMGLRAARGEVVVRVDGHTVIAPDYVRSCVTALSATGAANVGGRMEPAGITAPGAAIALATTSRFGVPTAFHTPLQPGVVARETDTVYLGAWPREVLVRLGGFDETLRVNEDYELNYRIRRAGGRIYLIPAIRSTYYGRQSFGAFARRYYAYGAGKAEMLRRHPRSLRPRHLVAPAFVASLAAGPALAALGKRVPERSSEPRSRMRLVLRWARVGWLAMLAIYAGLNAAATRRAVRRAPRAVSWRVALRVPVAFGLAHIAWGTGFWAGLLTGSPRRPRPSRSSPQLSSPASAGPTAICESPTRKRQP
jgi:GT2 family glycosyltransferase